MLWDIFCKVIDNHGDIGVCWRLACGLAARGCQVRLRVDDASALAWMAPQGAAGVQVLPWEAADEPGDAVVEAFGCELPAGFQARLKERALGSGHQPAWINVEYLTAEDFAQRTHGLPSPVMAGPAHGLVKRFFYPGFVAGTGGLLREPDLLARQAAFDAHDWLRSRGIATREGELRVSLFCYEPARLGELLEQLSRWPTPVRMLVTAGRATDAVRALGGGGGSLALSFLPLMTQREYDHLLWSCDLNFVRGEDSLVRALWAGKPFVWQLYPQHDGAHFDKLAAFLDWLAPPADLAQCFRAWNGSGEAWPPLAPAGPPEPTVKDATADAVPVAPRPMSPMATWSAAVRAARERVLAQDDLVTQLLAFAQREVAA